MLLLLTAVEHPAMSDMIKTDAAINRLDTGASLPVSLHPFGDDSKQMSII